MPAPYNLTGFHSSGFFDKIIILDTAVSGGLGLALVVLQFIITLFLLKQKWPLGSSFIATSFLSALFSSILYAAGMLNEKYLLVIIVILGVSSLITYVRND